MSDICEWFTQYIDLAEDVVIIKFSDGTTKTVKRGIYLKEVEDNIRKMLIDQVDRPTGRWIPVTERLPEDVHDVLCWYIYSKNDKLYQTYGIGFYWNEIWGGEKWYGERCKVIAWMPLPEPYKAESEEV